MIKKTCAICGKDFETASSKQKRCECCMKSGAKLAYKRTCKKCGKDFETHRFSRTTCEDCNKSRVKKTVYEKTCEVCGKEFTTKNVRTYKCEDCKPKQWMYDSDRMISCIVCGKEFNPITQNNTKCSKECCRKFAVDNRRETRNRDREDKFKGKIEGVDFIVCKICGVKAEQLHATHFNHVHGITTEEYLERFPDAQLMSLEFKKRIFGDTNMYTNQIHKHNDNIEPLSYITISLLESLNIEYDNLYDNFKINNTILNKITEILYPHTVNLNRDIFYNMISKLPLNNKGWGIFSVGSIKFFLDILRIDMSEQYFLYGLNEMQLSDEICLKTYKYDLTNIKTKRIIEYNGDYWHCNPYKYKSEYYHKLEKMSAQDIWDRDKQKIDYAISQGYEVMVVWEKDFKDNPDEVLKKCREFIL